VVYDVNGSLILRGGLLVKKWVCNLCGYVWEGESPPEECPVCGAPSEEFSEVVE